MGKAEGKTKVKAKVKTKGKGKWARNQTKKSIMLLLPSLICIGVLSLFPILRGIYIGFTNYKIGMPIKFNGLDNYSYILKNGYLKTALYNTLFILVVSLIAIYLMSIIIAVLLNSNIPFRKFWRVLLIIPWAVPPVAKVGVWQKIFSVNNGQLNYLLSQLHLIDKNIGWVSDERFAIFSVITIIVWGCIPFTAMSFLASMQNIPEENYEAAQLDGANAFQKFLYITLPELREISMVTVSLLFMWITTDFSSQYLLTKGGPGSATLTISVESYLEAFKYGNFGTSTAYGNVMMIICAVVVFFYIRMLRQKED